MIKTYAIVQAINNVTSEYFCGMVVAVLDLEMTEKTLSETALCGFLHYVIKTDEEKAVFESALEPGEGKKVRAEMLNLDPLKGELGEDIITRLQDPSISVPVFESQYSALLQNSFEDVI